MNKNYYDIYKHIQELSWYFGNQGFDGECCSDLTLVEFMAVKNTYEKENIKVQELGFALNITKGGVSKIIDRLENKGYVQRKQSSKDGRVCCIVITHKGKEVIENIERHYAAYIGDILKDLEPQSIDNVIKVLDLLITSIRKQGFIKSI
jgi:DNA-binding MarR family transcriptional regulator